MCDEAGGCVRLGGNFRGVCPITGRQQILVTGVDTVRRGSSSEPGLPRGFIVQHEAGCFLCQYRAGTAAACGCAPVGMPERLFRIKRTLRLI